MQISPSMRSSVEKQLKNRNENRAEKAINERAVLNSVSVILSLICIRSTPKRVSFLSFLDLCRNLNILTN